MKLPEWFRGKDGYVKLTVAVIVLAAILRFALAALSHPAGDSCYHLSVARFMAENSRLPLFEPFGISRADSASRRADEPLLHRIA